MATVPVAFATIVAVLWPHSSPHAGRNTCHHADPKIAGSDWMPLTPDIRAVCAETPPAASPRLVHRERDKGPRPLHAIHVGVSARAVSRR